MTELVRTLAECRGRGYVVAPAGFGKTHLIAAAVGIAHKKQLVLTHTYAGVNALRQKMRQLDVRYGACHVDTIASWALRLCLSYGLSSGWNTERPDRRQWVQLYRACSDLLEIPFIRRILRASYDGLYVDEYQDCSAPQHQLVLKLARDLPCRILGDPLQAIFDFDDSSAVDWRIDVETNFEPLGGLEIPHRWIRAGRPGLGAWLQRTRRALENGQPIDLAEDIAGLSFKPALDDVLHVEQANLCRYFACGRQDRVIAIHKGHQQYKAKCHTLARSIGGRFSSIEEIEGKELFRLVRRLGCADSDQSRLAELVSFAERCMTKVATNLSAATKRGEPVAIRAKTKNPTVAIAANHYLSTPCSATMAAFLAELERVPGVGVVRADLFNRMKGVLYKHTLHPELSLGDAAEKYHSEFRYRGRPVGRRRLIGTTLLVKGLEFDHAIVLDAGSLARKELYVALTRGATSLTVISATPMLDPSE
jgi:hypothetical protein